MKPLTPDAFDGAFSPWQPDPDKAHDFPGSGFAPWVYFNDYVGPRLDCPAILRAPDADAPYSAKYDLLSIDPFDPVSDLPSVLPTAPHTSFLTPAPLAHTQAWLHHPAQHGGRIISGSSSTPGIEWPCDCGVQPAPIPLEASAIFLATAIVALLWIRRAA